MVIVRFDDIYASTFIDYGALYYTAIKMRSPQFIEFVRSGYGFEIYPGFHDGRGIQRKRARYVQNLMNYESAYYANK